jgi:hypothetical protein
MIARVTRPAVVGAGIVFRPLTVRRVPTQMMRLQGQRVRSTVQPYVEGYLDSDVPSTSPIAPLYIHTLLPRR